MKILGSKDITIEDLRVMGGKAGRLHELKEANFPVPSGFVIRESQASFEHLIDSIGGFPVAVRSSGSLEDLENASFAGLYETFLFIKNQDELKLAVAKCFESKNSARVQDYLKTKNIEYSDDKLAMSVLVQRMVNAKIAGVLFTLNPTNGREEEIYLEYCEGVGERLVSGHVTPTRAVYNWQSDIKVSEFVNDEQTKLSDELLKELIDLAVKIQAFYGTPQDIEWAIGPDDRVYILQSRPVTVFTPRDDRPELTNADLKDGGISARVCTHFMFSVYRDALKFSMGEYFKKIHLIPNDEKITWIHYHYGRVYWNAEAVKEGLKKIPDFKEDDFDRDLGIQKDYGSVGPHKTPLTVSGVVEAIPVLIGLNQEFSDCESMIDQFRIRFELRDEELKSKLPSLNRLSDKDFKLWFLDVILFQNETEKNYFRTIYNNSNFQTEYKSFLKKLRPYEAGDEIDLMGELHSVSHLDVQSGLQKLREVADFYGFDSRTYYSQRQAFLKVHYHHGPAELDLLVPRWGEKKEWVDELVNSFVPTSGPGFSPYQQTYEKIYRKIGIFKKSKFAKLTMRSRNFLKLREEMRAFSTRAYYLLRLGLLEFAQRKSISEIDAFMLDIQEVKSILLHNSSIPDIRKRRFFYEGYRKFHAPNEFGWAIKAQNHSYTDGHLKGLGCSPGQIVGRARVILDIHATGTLTKEDILVTAFTDPGWTPVLARVGGVVTEVGGLLSHAAVIGREYGIPAVLNLIHATRIIKDGDIIKVDGKTGIVEVLEKGPKG